jgi:hypothetical protein
MDNWSLKGFLSLDNSKFESGLDKASASAKNFAGSLAATGASMGAAFGAAFGAVNMITSKLGKVGDWFGQSVKDTAELKDIIEQTLLDPRTAQQYRFIFEQTGSSMGAVIKAMTQMATMREELFNGSDLEKAKAGNFFGKFGLDAESLRGMSLEQTFETVGNGLAKITDATEALAAARETFGKQGASLLPAFRDGLEGWKKKAEPTIIDDAIMEELDRLEKLQKLNDAQNKVIMARTATSSGWVKAMEGLAWVKNKGMQGIGKIADLVSGPGDAARDMANATGGFLKSIISNSAEKKPEGDGIDYNEQLVAPDFWEKKAERVAKLNDQIAGLREGIFLASLEPAARLNDLLEKQAGILENLATEEEARAEQMKNALELERDIQKLEQTKVEGRARKLTTNELNRIGSFESMQSMTLAMGGKLQTDMLALQKQVAQNTARIAANTNGGGLTL